LNEDLFHASKGFLLRWSPSPWPLRLIGRLMGARCQRTGERSRATSCTDPGMTVRNGGPLVLGFPGSVSDVAVALSGNDVPQVDDFSLAEVTFFRSASQAANLEPFEHELEVFNVLFVVGRVHDDVIQVQP
jgi:hypothetical protein